MSEWAVYWLWSRSRHAVNELEDLSKDSFSVKTGPSSSRVLGREFLYAVFPDEASAKDALSNIEALKSEFFRKRDALQKRYTNKVKRETKKRAHEAYDAL